MALTIEEIEEAFRTVWGGGTAIPDALVEPDDDCSERIA